MVTHKLPWLFTCSWNDCRQQKHCCNLTVQLWNKFCSFQLSNDVQHFKVVLYCWPGSLYAPTATQLFIAGGYSWDVVERGNVEECICTWASLLYSDIITCLKSSTLFCVVPALCVSKRTVFWPVAPATFYVFRVCYTSCTKAARYSSVLCVWRTWGFVFV